MNELISIKLILIWPIIVLINPITPLENGLARTPIMGWLSWTKFMCNIDCRNNPDNCISENLFKTMADIMVNEGYKDVGYNYLNIDDCWAERKRNSTGHLVSDRVRFQHGIPWLVKYAHSRELKMGIYANFGQKTCMGFAGTTLRDMEIDARTFAAWSVDMLKFDGCFNDPKILDNGILTLVNLGEYLFSAYLKMGNALKKSGKSMVYACSWPYYQLTQTKQWPNYDLIVENCNMWRNFHDIQLNFAIVRLIIQFYNENQDKLAKFHGPGHFNDPDMLIVGNSELSVNEARVQMAIWCIWSAPLLMSNDLRHVSKEHKAILQNVDLIALNQDPLVKFGKMVMKKGTKDEVLVYLKEITPVVEKKGIKMYSYAVAFYNVAEIGSEPVVVKMSLLELGIPKNSVFHVKELLQGTEFGEFSGVDPIVIEVPPVDARVIRCLLSGDNGDQPGSKKNALNLPKNGRDFNMNIAYLFVCVAVVIIIVVKVFKSNRRLRRLLPVF